MNLPLNQLHPDEIKQLDAEDLVRLLHRLLHCEARKHQIKNPGILVPFQINVPDGGSDGKWHTDIGTHEYIPRPLTYYQCKAEHITAASCRDEVVVERKKDGKIFMEVKPRVREVLSIGGCYAFFSSEQEIERSNTTSLNASVRTALQDANFLPHTDALIEFFGCNRIADWANQFPSAIRFVREQTKNLGGVHFHTIESWQKQIEQQGPYFANDTLREKIAAIRHSLTEGKTRIIRLTGLSGLGKTRLAFEALKRIEGDTVVANAIAAETIYLCYADVSDALMNFINHIATGQYSAIVVIDDCPPLIHDRIATVVAPSALSIITIYHEPEVRRNDTHPLTIEPDALADVVENILRQDPYLLERGPNAIKAVAKFTQGFPQIAKLITEFHRAPTTQELSNRAGLFQKLLSAGAEPNTVTLNTVQSLALFRVVGGSRKKLDADLEAIRTIFCPVVSAIDFRRVIDDQKRRRIIQVTADTLTVAPLPLAVALATDFLNICPGEWKEHLTALDAAGLVADFARRIEELEVSETVEELGRLFLEEKIPFDDAEYLLTGATAAQIFRAFTVLNPLSASKVAKKALQRVNLERLRKVTDARRSLVRALEVMVWDRGSFFNAAPLLLRLAAAENEAWANNATGEFSQLYHVFLSGTTVPAIERLVVIRDAFDSSEEAIRRVAAKALGAGLRDGHYSRMDDATLGGKRDANKDWQPSNHDEILAYWKECYQLLQQLILAGGPESQTAKEALGNNIQGILSSRLLLVLEQDFKKLAAHFRGYWPEVKTTIRNMLEMDQNLAADHRAALERWRADLTPPAVAIEERLRDIVTKPGWHHHKEADGHFTDLSQADAEKFAQELSAAATDLRPHLSQLLAGEQQQATVFGLGLARKHPEARALFESGLSIWPTVNAQRNDSLLRGLFHGCNRDYQTKVLETISADEARIDLLIPLTGALLQITEADFLRVRSAIERKQIPANMLRKLIPGLPLRSLPDSFLKEQFTEWAQATPEASAPLFQVLYLYCHGEPARFQYFMDTFRVLILMPGLPLSETQFAWEWNEAAIKLIRSTADNDWLAGLARYVVGVISANKTLVGTEYLRKATIELFRKAPSVTWPPFAALLTEEKNPNGFFILEFLAGGGHGFEEEGEASPIWELPMEQFREWIDAHRNLVPLLLDRIQLYTVEKQAPETQVFYWHPHVLALIEMGTDEDKIARELFGNLWSFGSTGSRLPYWERRLLLVKELATFENPRFRRISRQLEEHVQEAIEQTKNEELNEQARFH